MTLNSFCIGEIKLIYIYLKQYVRIILNIFYWWLLALFSAMKSQTQTEFFQVYQIELSFFVQQILFYILHSMRISILPYLGLYNVQDFAHILYFVGGVHIINKNNVFHSFPDQEITCLPCFFVYYCQHAKLNISSYENTNKTQHI